MDQVDCHIVDADARAGSSTDAACQPGSACASASAGERPRPVCVPSDPRCEADAAAPADPSCEVTASTSACQTDPVSRLAAFDHFAADVRAELATTTAHMDELRAQQKVKSATYRQLFAIRATLKDIDRRLAERGL